MNYWSDYFSTNFVLAMATASFYCLNKAGKDIVYSAAAARLQIRFRQIFEADATPKSEL